MSQIRFGIVGAGAISRSYVQAITGSEEAVLVGVADIDSTAAGRLGAEAGVPAYEGHRLLADAAKPDAVVVCTPPSSHAAITIDLLEAGVAVVCEKPLCIGVNAARRMVATAERTGTLMTMGSKFRYVDDVTTARDLVGSGAIGEVTLYENVFTGRVSMRERWNSAPAVSGGGVLIDNGTHSVDIMRYLLGPVKELQAVEGKRSQGLTVDETVHLSVHTADGVLGSIDLSWSVHKDQPSYIDLHGTEGSIRVGWRESLIKRAGSASWERIGNGYDKVQAFRSQIENFCRALSGREPLRITAEDAIASVAVIDAAYASLRQHNWVPIDE